MGTEERVSLAWFWYMQLGVVIMTLPGGAQAGGGGRGPREIMLCLWTFNTSFKEGFLFCFKD